MTNSAVTATPGVVFLVDAGLFLNHQTSSATSLPTVWLVTLPHQSTVPC